MCFASLTLVCPCSDLLTFGNDILLATFRALIYIGPLEPVSRHFLLTFWTFRQIKGVDLVLDLGLDALKFFFKLVKVTRQHLAPRNECRKRVDVYTDDFSSES